MSSPKYDSATQSAYQWSGLPGSISRTSTPPSPAMHNARIRLSSGMKYGVVI